MPQFKSIPERDALLFALHAERIARAEENVARWRAAQREIAARVGLARGEAFVTEPDAPLPIGTVVSAQTGQPVALPPPSPPASAAE